MSEEMKSPNEAEVSVSVEEMARVLEELRSNQNVAMGVIGGAAGALIGAIIWAVITVLTQYQIGWMAIGLGFLAGMGVKLLGKGIDLVFSIIGAVLGVIGSLLGNIFAYFYMQWGMEMLNYLTPHNIGVVIESTFEVMDLVYYGIAGYMGFAVARINPLKDYQKPNP